MNGGVSPLYCLHGPFSMHLTVASHCNSLLRKKNMARISRVDRFQIIIKSFRDLMLKFSQWTAEMCCFRMTHYSESELKYRNPLFSTVFSLHIDWYFKNMLEILSFQCWNVVHDGQETFLRCFGLLIIPYTCMIAKWAQNFRLLYLSSSLSYRAHLCRLSATS